MRPTRGTVDNLNDLMEIDHVVTVHADGTVSDGPQSLYAPSVYGDSSTGTEEIQGDGWEFASIGYTGQYGVRQQPGMHDSEFIGGQLARDILATPGTYVAVAVWWPVDEDDANVTEQEIEDGGVWEGWVVLRRTV